MAGRNVVPISRHKHTGDLAVYGHWAAGKRDNRAFRDHGNAGPNAANASYLPTMRGRVHDVVRNVPMALQAIEILQTDIVGSGIVARPESDAVQQMLTAWADECDADGVNDLYGLQEAVVGAWMEGGEAFVRLRPRRPSDGLIIPLQLQVMEAEMLPLFDQPLNNGNEIRQGIEFDRRGRRVAYWFHRSHPGDYYTSAAEFGQLTRVPASMVLHIYELRRPGQIRGVPRLATALQRMQQMGDMDEATIERQKQASHITFVITRPLPDSAGIDPVTGEPVEEDREVSDIDPGSAYRLLPGEDLKTPDLPSVGRDYDEFTTWQARWVAAGAGVPYQLLTNDFRDVNDRTLRTILGAYRRRIGQHQKMRLIHQMLRPIATAAIDLGVMLGEIDPGVSRKVPWIPPAWPYIHPVQDVEAAEREVLAGFNSRRNFITSRGRNPDDVLAENIRDTKEAERHGLEFATGLSAETDKQASARVNAEARATALHDAEMRAQQARLDEHRANQDLARAKSGREQAESEWRQANAELCRAQAERERVEAEQSRLAGEASRAEQTQELQARLATLAAERDQAVAESKARIKAAEKAARAAAHEAAARSEEERQIQAERLQVARLEREAAEAGLAELKGAA